MENYSSQFTTEEILKAKTYDFNKVDLDMIENIRTASDQFFGHLLNFSQGIYPLENLIFSSEVIKTPKIGELPKKLEIDYSINEDTIKTHWKVNKSGKPHLDVIDEHPLSSLLKWGIENNSDFWEPIPSKVDFVNHRMLHDTSATVSVFKSLVLSVDDLKNFETKEIPIPFIHCSLYDDIHSMPFVGFADNKAMFYKAFMDDVHDCPDFCKHTILTVDNGIVNEQEDDFDKLLLHMDISGTLFQVIGSHRNFPEKLLAHTYNFKEKE